ncbi:MAG: DUF6152 family protein [Candidatus Rariloculaceae bacterium]
MTPLRPLPVAVVLAAGLTTTVWAHHSRNNFDLETLHEFQGVITEYSWRNPHTFVTVAVENESVETRELLMELNSISVLNRAGWTRDTLSVGDKVTVFANADKDPDKNLYYSNYWLLPDGSTMASAPGSAPASIPQTERRQVDTTATSEDFSGIWVSLGGPFGFGGMGMGMGGGAPAGPSLGGQNAATGLPLTVLGQAELDGWNVEDNPWFRCISKTPPWLYSGVGAHRFTRYNDRIVIRHEINDVERVIHLGQTEHPADTVLSQLGHSIGWFEGETLVVDTAYFTAAEWGIGSGVSSSAEKHLLERLTLTEEGRRMEISYTIEDPVYLTEPVSLTTTLALDVGYPFQDNYGCDPQAAGRHIKE